MGKGPRFIGFSQQSRIGKLEAENKQLREKIKEGYELITKCTSEKTVEKRCKSWNDGLSILREIALEG